MKKKETKEEKIIKEEAYVNFLKTRLNSENYKAAVTKEEYNKEKFKYDKAKLKLKFLIESK
ncbi:MAG: hypothetical protein ABIP51_20065 [Bacteroidia bacterium]